MNSCSPQKVNALLEAAGPGATVFLIGAGGCGMSGLGHLLLDLGWTVAGSDLASNLEVQQLQERGAVIHQGHAAEQLIAAKPVLVVYSSAIRLHNPELQAARQLHLPIVHRAVLLAALLLRQSGICVAGMHGKTTTTALLSFALEHLNANPSYAIGALVPQLRRHARFATGGSAPASLPPLARASAAASAPGPADAGASARPGQALFVIEADESDGTLREFEPDYAIVLNIDEEHLDFYANVEAICSAFGQFTQKTRRTVVFCADDPRVAELMAHHPQAISYGFSSRANYRLVPQPVAPAALAAGAVSTRFEVWKAASKLGEFTLALYGDQNISNAGAVIAFLHHLGYGAPEIAAAIAPFRGAARRQQELFRDERFSLYDDYGHHPAEIAATLRSFKRRGARRLLVAFQPHRFSRTQLLLKQFSTCFQEADQLWVTEIYAASEPELAGVNGALLAKAVQAAGQPVEFIPSLEQLREAVRAAMLPGDLVLFLGAGDITKAAHSLAAQLERERAANQGISALPQSISSNSRALLGNTKINPSVPYEVIE